MIHSVQASSRCRSESCVAGSTMSGAASERVHHPIHQEEPCAGLRLVLSCGAAPCGQARSQCRTCGGFAIVSCGRALSVEPVCWICIFKHTALAVGMAQWCWAWHQDGFRQRQACMRASVSLLGTYCNHFACIATFLSTHTAADRDFRQAIQKEVTCCSPPVVCVFSALMKPA